MMYCITCNKTGCVKMISDNDPRLALPLADNFDEHYTIYKFENKQAAEYARRHTKIVEGNLIDLGDYIDLVNSNKLDDCDECPRITKDS